MSDDDFDALEDRVEALAAQSQAVGAEHAAQHHGKFDPAHNEQDFMKLVGQAMDELPSPFRQALDHVAVTVSNQGSVQQRDGKAQPLYGLYVGYADHEAFVIGAPSRGAAPDRIVIFRDTLCRDFGADPRMLKEQVTRTLRHELGHHLGLDEDGVRSLGL